MTTIRAAFALIVLLTTVVARAEPDPAVVQEAREAYRLGTTLTRQGQWKEALAAYQRSSELHAHATTTYNMAYCERALTHLTRAHLLFKRALEQHAARSDLPERSVVKARAYLKELEARLARASVTVASVEMKVSIDGRPLSAADGKTFVAGIRPLGPPESVGTDRFDVLLDPGDHVIVVTRGQDERAVSQTVLPGSSIRLVLGEDLLPPPPVPSIETDRVGAYVALGLAGAATIAGIIAVGIAADAKGDLDDACAEFSCPETAIDDLDRLQHASDIATASFVIAGATAVLGTVLIFVSPTVRTSASMGRVEMEIRF